MTTHNGKGPAPEQASEAAQQRSGMDRPFTEVVPSAEVIVDARAGDGNETSSKVSRADPLTEESARKTAHRIYCNLGYCGSDPHCFNGADSVTQQRWIRAVKDAAPLFCSSAVEQPGSITTQIALAAIETFEIVGESNDSREPNADDRFILTEFIAHAFGGFRVEQPAAAPTIEHNLQGIARIDLELVEREARAFARTPPAPAPTDERAAFVKLMGYDRPETEGVAVDVWDSQRATWLEALAFAHAPLRERDRTEGTMALPHWFETFLTNVCEIPDRNSPEGEPDAIVATLDELRDCALNAIEQCGSWAAPAQAAEPVGEIVAFGPDLKEVSWRAGKMPEIGTKLYAAPQSPAQAEALEGLTTDRAFALYMLARTMSDSERWISELRKSITANSGQAAGAEVSPDDQRDGTRWRTLMKKGEPEVYVERTERRVIQRTSAVAFSSPNLTDNIGVSTTSEMLVKRYSIFAWWSRENEYRTFTEAVDAIAAGAIQ